MAGSALNFDGNEQIGKIIDTFKASSQQMHNPEVTLTTLAGSFNGRIVSKGSQWLVLEEKTGRKPVGSKQEVMKKSLIAVTDIVAISFEVLSE